MARSRTLTLLIADVRARTDKVNSTFVTDAQITEWINQGWTELYDFLIQSGEKYYLTKATFATTGGTDTYALPADHYKTLGVDVQFNGSQWNECHRFQFEERNAFQQGGGSWTWPVSVRYDLQGSNIIFTPAPGNVFTVRHWYYPVAARLVVGGSTDTLDGVNGWEQYVVDWASAKVADKDDNAELAGRLMGGLGALAQRILTMASTRHPGEAPKVRVVRGKPLTQPMPRRWWGF